MNTKEVANMDKIIKAEFKKRFPVIVARTISRTVAQTLIQYELKKKGGLIGGIIGAAYQGVMNRTDIRQWKMLPKDFQIARIELKSQRLVIFAPNRAKLVDIKVDPNMNHIVFVRIPKRNKGVIYNNVSF